MPVTSGLLAVDAPGGTVGPDTILPGSQQVLPALFLLLAIVAGAVAVVVVVLRVVRSRRGAARRAPVVLSVSVAVAVLAAGCAWVTRPPAFFVPRFGPLPALVPADSVFRRTATDLPVSTDSERWIAAVADLPLRPGFSGRVVDGVVWGVPYNFVDTATPRRQVTIKGRPQDSFPGPYPISDPAYVENMPTYHFDMHYVGLDSTTGDVWELLSLRNWFGHLEADSGAHYQLGSNDYPHGSSIAVDMPLVPGIITFDEVAAGSVDHVTLAGIERSAPRWVWPARNSDGRSSAVDALPQGAWMRLRADADVSKLGPQARVVAAGLQRYGLIVSDTGGGFGLRGTPDGRWDDDDLATLSTLHAGDFEVVDPSAIVVDQDRLAVRPPA